MGVVRGHAGLHPNCAAAHPQIANHPGLLAVGAALELAAVMQREPDPYRRINATMAVALLVGWVVGANG